MVCATEVQFNMILDFHRTCYGELAVDFRYFGKFNRSTSVRVFA